MAVAAKKKLKVFQIAKELNLSHETLKEFLEKKGMPFKGPNMRIDEDTYELLLQRFSHEKKVAEKIHKRREERIREEQDVETTVEVAETSAQETVPETEAEEIAEAEEAVETTADDSAEISQEKVEIAETAEAVAEEAEEENVAEEATPELETETPEVSAEEEIKPDETEAEAEPAEAEPEPETAEKAESTETIEVVEQSTEFTPQVGDIIDHPMAKQFLERQKREEELKKERKKKALKRLKSKEEKKAGKKTEEEKLPLGSEAVPADQEKPSKTQERKKARKKGQKEEQEEREARRKKAYEMMRRESKRIRPQMVSADESEEEGVAPKAKEGRRKRKKKKEVDQKEVESSLKKTLAEMRDVGVGRKKRRKIKTEDGQEIEESNIIKVTEFITTQDLANLLEVPATTVIGKCLEMGLVVTINQRLDMDTIKLLAEEFGYTIEEEEEFASEFLEEIDDEEDSPEELQPRPPVVTVMGHVDHGKTSLLDYIRETNVVSGESGSITQHIGAYEVRLDDGRKITFLDTPGHEAFTAMRARGAQVTDIVVLVIAADDRVMPQTEEALDHARAAGVSIVIAINKVDKPNANPEGIRQQLAERNVLVEDWGGNYQCVEVSAKTGKNISELVEKILLEAELLDLKANPNKRARGVILESQLDKGKGAVATVLVQSGTLEVGNAFLAGQHSGRVRAMFNDRGQRVESAGPSMPVQVLGFDGIPEAGDRLIVMQDEKTVKEIAIRRQQLKREQDFRQVKLMTLDELSKQIKAGMVKDLNLLVKADVDGSAQALSDALLKLSTDSVAVNIIRRAVGPISESDVVLAAASNAIIIGFHVRPSVAAKARAEKEHVDIRLYKVIYDAIEDVENALEGMLEPVEREIILGTVEIREVFKISRIGTVGGCYVTEGKITRNARVRLIRNDVEIYDGKLSSLKRFKEDVREVQSGYECGLTIENYNDIKVGDIIEAYETVMEAQKLDRKDKKSS